MNTIDLLPFISSESFTTFAFSCCFTLLGVHLFTNHPSKFSIKTKLSSQINLQEYQSERIASDIHDDLGAVISTVKLQLQTLSIEMKKDEFQESVSETVSNVDMLLQNIRFISKNLSTVTLKKNGLLKSLEEYARLIEVSRRINFQIKYEVGHTHLTESAEINIYRIIQELINNTLKHSNCSLIKLAIKKYDKKLLIIYCDNGKTRNAYTSISNGAGIENIFKRVELLDGDINYKADFTDGCFYQILFENKLIFSKNHNSYA